MTTAQTRYGFHALREIAEQNPTIKDVLNLCADQWETDDREWADKVGAEMHRACFDQAKAQAIGSFLTQLQESVASLEAVLDGHPLPLDRDRVADLPQILRRIIITYMQVPKAGPW